ncbi:hypothetical protein NJB18185_01340, partial [Mycobacterium montefiorense]
RPAVPRPHRRTRELVVVPTLPTPTTTNNQLGSSPPPVMTSTGSKPKRVGYQEIRSRYAQQLRREIQR